MGIAGAEPTNAEKFRGLPWDLAFSAANSVFVQFTFFGSVFVLFLSELGLSKSQIGTLLSLLPFSGLLALIVAPTVARIGYKRAALLSWSTRTIVTAPILLTPLVSVQFGYRAVLLYVTAILAAFSVFRAVGMTARLPWVQEFVPDSVRGKFSALGNMFSQMAAFVAVLVAGFIVEGTVGLTGFIILFGLGVLFGFVAVWAETHVPGGAPRQGSELKGTSYRDMARATRDANFVRFLGGVGLVILVGGPLASFLPLYMQEEVGISSGRVVWVQNGTLLGGLLFSYLWGWLADRYGGKPVMMSGIALRAVVPILWLLVPKNSPVSLHIALMVAFAQGVANMGWFIGSTRLRFVAVVPAEGKANYQALYLAWIGVIGGLGQLAGGWMLEVTSGVSGRLLFLPVNSYTILFLVGAALAIVAAVVMRRVRADTAMTTGAFAAMFFRGNPFSALASLIRFHRARGERATVSMTERLGRTESPLTVEELLAALADPRFAVRFEAVVSIARRGPDERLTSALVDVLGSSEPALSTVAAWALGRIGDERAIPPLRAGLDAEYRSVRAYCARALGTMGDVDVKPLLIKRLGTELDQGLRVAYSSALGKLRATEALPALLRYLRVCGIGDEMPRNEYALAVARIVGAEDPFLGLLRETEVDPGTSTSQALAAAGRGLTDPEGRSELTYAIEQCEDALAREDLQQGAESLVSVLRLVRRRELGEPFSTVLGECAERLDEFGEVRIEYLVLAINTLREAASSNLQSVQDAGPVSF